ncbi:hypothetical protein EVA_12616 [gut metagenome]|uniref:Uncharacterized protein n=1 Tax=gut metagenome TaxID=749906 RepID=J9FW98_9ZZZZ
MIGFYKIMLHIAASLGHVRIIGHHEKSMFLIHQFFTFTNHSTNAVTLLIQVLQFLLFDDIIGLLFIGVVHITLQINHIFQCPESGFL